VTTLGFVPFCFLLAAAAADDDVEVDDEADGDDTDDAYVPKVADVAADADDADHYAGYHHHENALQELVGFLFTSPVQFPRRDETLSPFSRLIGNCFLPHPSSCIHASITSCWLRGSFRVQLLPSAAPVLI
jgi:hypothetical protein